MLQDHNAGERVSVDYVGLTVPVEIGGSDETRKAQILVAVLGASSYFYAEATYGRTRSRGSAYMCGPWSSTGTASRCWCRTSLPWRGRAAGSRGWTAPTRRSQGTEG